jgi:hypothetical protein
VYSQWTSLDSKQGPATARQLEVAKFQPPASCSALVQVELRIRGELCGILRVENRDPVAGCVNFFSLGPLGIIVSPGPGQGLDFLNDLLPPLVLKEDLAPVGLGPWDGRLDFDGTSGMTVAVGPVEDELCVRITDPARLAAFVDDGIGPGLLYFDHEAIDSSSTMGCAPQTFKSDPFGGVEIDVVYRYCTSEPPVTPPVEARVCSDGAVDIDVLAGVTDPEGVLDCESLAITVPPLHGTAEIVGCSGSGASCPGCIVRYTPSPGYAGGDAFGYRVSDASGLSCSSDGEVTVDVCRTTAADDGANVCRGGSVAIPVTGNHSSGKAFRAYQARRRVLRCG